MSGKSALLRQTAINVLLAQTGCFVAADSARIGVVDKIFTRVGASDNISLGESTFMVEMTEAASILNNMSSRSLILFDELGRGTSTYDGISIAWSIVEYIHDFGGLHPKTLFATHYHELNEMERNFPRVVNFNVAVREIQGKVVFLRKLEKGGSEHSFGIHVAKLAGMPRSIVSRADEVLRRLEQANTGENKERIKGSLSESAAARNAEGGGVQLSFFQLDDPVLSQIRDEILATDINNLTPLAALTKQWLFSKSVRFLHAKTEQYVFRRGKRGRRPESRRDGCSLTQRAQKIGPALRAEPILYSVFNLLPFGQALVFRLLCLFSLLLFGYIARGLFQRLVITQQSCVEGPQHHMLLCSIVKHRSVGSDGVVIKSERVGRNLIPGGMSGQIKTMTHAALGLEDEMI